MPEIQKNYETCDKSRQALPFESPHFPPFFRLFKWKILDICVESVSPNNEYGCFEKFTSLFEPGELYRIADEILNTRPPPNPYKAKIENAALDEKMRKQAEAYAAFRIQHNAKVKKRRNIEFFMKKVLYTEEGLRIADEIVYNHNYQVYGWAHWDTLPKGWVSAETFRARFYDDENIEDRCSHQKLDKVAGCARGNLILPHFNGNSRVEGEYKTFLNMLSDPVYRIKTSLVEDVIADGPMYKLETKDGEEKRVQLDRWNEHKTRMLFVAIPGFRENEKKVMNEHEDWYFYLLDAMRHDPYNRAALTFLNKNYAEELEEKENERQRQTMMLLKGLNTSEQGVEGEVVKEIRPQPDDSGFQCDAEVSELNLRSYQEELVQPAIEGRNCVVVAPTGAGKTEVAIYAALHHIGERVAHRKAARVVMLVPKIPLVNQQKNRFLNYCRGKYHVEGFHGSEESKTGNGRRDDVLRTHISVMTSQILINMLQSVRKSERLYVSDFTMMVFDEVHRTTGNHPYVLINRIVQEWNYDKPQIIGLTASLNVSATAHVDQNAMLDSIYQMLALLNAPNLSTITKQENIDELNKHVGKPDDTVEVCEPPNDQENPLRGFIKRVLHTYHTKLCNELDSLSHSRHNSFPANNYRIFKKEKPEKFVRYEALLQNVMQDLNKLNTAEKAVAQLYTRYIKVYVEARMIIDVMPPSVAFDFMSEALEKLNKTHKMTQFSDFENSYETLENNIDNKEPKIVQKLKGTLIEQFRMTPDSRVIIFVTQRSTAQRVCEFLNKSRIMDQFKDVLDSSDSVGYVLGTNNNGAVSQSPQEQQRTIDRFNNGKLKVMVATSVIEEGLDVTACNLIIKYNCSSGSAIQLIQQRGRARAKNSRSVLLCVSNVENQKENTALISEKFMKACVSTIVKNSQKQLESKVMEVKKRLDAEIQRELEEQRNIGLRHGSKEYKIRCAQCNTEFCRSTAMRKVYSNYMAMDPTVWNQLALVSRSKKIAKAIREDVVALSEIQCNKCKVAVGKAYKMRGVYLPQLIVKQLTFELINGNVSDMETKAKWSSVEAELFFVQEATQVDFETMLNALNTSAANIEKKRLLDFDSKQHVKTIETSKEAHMSEKETKRLAEAEKRASQSDDEEDQRREETDA